MKSVNHFMQLFFIGAILQAGCTTKLSDNIAVPVGEMALQESLPRAEAIGRLEKHLQEAIDNEMPFLAPHYFNEASDMVKSISKTSRSNVSVEDIARADALLDRGEAVSAMIKKHFAKELEIKAKMDKLSAKDIYPVQYRMVIYDFSGLIEKVELDKAGNIDRDKEALAQELQELYDKAVQYTSSQESSIINKK